DNLLRMQWRAVCNGTRIEVCNRGRPVPSVALDHPRIAPHRAAQAPRAPSSADDRGPDAPFAALLETDVQTTEPKDDRGAANATPADRKRVPQKSERRDEPTISAKSEPAPDDSKIVVKDGKGADATRGE